MPLHESGLRPWLQIRSTRDTHICSSGRGRLARSQVMLRDAIVALIAIIQSAGPLRFLRCPVSDQKRSFGGASVAGAASRDSDRHPHKGPQG
jgi:hypothetical protein